MTGVNNVIGKDNIGYGDLLTYLHDSRGIDISENATEKEIKAAAEEIGLTIDAFGNVIVKNYDTYIAALEQDVRELERRGASKEQINAK